MAKLIFLILTLFICTQTFSQSRFSIFGGGQATSADYVVRGNSQPNDYQRGIMAGIAAKIPFDNHLFFYPSLYYSEKGYKVRLLDPAFPPDSAAINNNTHLKTVEFAPLLHLAFSKSSSHVFLRFGPALDFNVSGREKFETNTGTTIERDMIFSFGDYGFATASANVHFGFQAGVGFQIFAHYAYGIGSLNNADDGPVIRHRVGGLSIGWTFGQNKDDVKKFLKKLNSK